MTEFFPLIVADIGGTNARFALASRHTAGGEVELTRIRTYFRGPEKNMSSLLQRYLDELEAAAPLIVCLGMAGPNDGRSGYMVNRDWKVDAGQLEKTCALQRVLLVNDFAALAAGVPALSSADTLVLNEGRSGDGPMSVIGPGTGLGVGLVVSDGGRHHVISTEGGHASFAPVRTLERELLDYLAPAGDYVSAEAILAGPGLVRIHQFIQHRAGLTAGVTEAELTPAAITAAALAGSDAHCVQTVDLFLECLGSVAGDLTLAHGATGGLYLGGGVLPRLAALLPVSGFMSRFLDKGPLREYLAKIPVKLIVAEHVALKGAAMLFWQSEDVN